MNNPFKETIPSAARDNEDLIPTAYHWNIMGT